MDAKLPQVSVAQQLAARIAALARRAPAAGGARRNATICWSTSPGSASPRATRTTSRRRSPASTTTGPARRSGTPARLSAAGAAFVNGTAAHGEDFDDTFEGGPVHAGAVIVPAVLAACERHKRDGAAALIGIAVGCEVMCRLSTVVPKAVHKAGFHPTAVFGVMGAAAGVAAALGLDAQADRRCARHRRQLGRRHHRISRRRRLDQAAASRLGGAVRLSARRCWRARAFTVRARCSKACTGCSMASRTPTQGDYARARRFRRALGDRDARLQALSVRDHGASLHRLRPAAGRARHQGRRRSRNSSARWRRAPCTGCGSRSPPSSARPTAMPRSSRRPSFWRPALCAAASASTPSPMRRCAIRPCSRSPPRCAT